MSRSRHSSTVATAASADSEVRLWDLATGRPLRPPLNDQGRVKSLTFGPDGKLLVFLSGGSQVWDVATGRRCQDLPYGKTPRPAEIGDDEDAAGNEDALIKEFMVHK